MSAATWSMPTPDLSDRMLNLNVNVVMKNVHDVLPHMIERRTGDIIVTSSLAAHFPTPWEPVCASGARGLGCELAANDPSRIMQTTSAAFLLK
jgi:NADP-dependent 3-hydroxy acid dehydrogenase YdfG